MPHNFFKLFSRRSGTEKARVVARIRRIGFIVLGIETIILFAANGFVCSLLPRGCAPAIPIASFGICTGLLALVVVAFRNPQERWPITALAIVISCAVGCLVVFIALLP